MRFFSFGKSGEPLKQQELDSQSAETESASQLVTSTDSGSRDDWDPRNNAEIFRTPLDLSITDRPISRWLVIGSCLASGFTEFVRALPNGADGDYLIFNNGVILPDEPPSPLNTYDCQFVQIPLRSIVPDLAHARIPFADIEEFDNLLASCLERLDFLFQSATKYSRNGEILTFVSNFIAPQQGTLGRLVGRRDIRNFSHFVRVLNNHLDDLVERSKNTFIIDVEDIVRSFGGKLFQDDILWQYNHGAAIGDNDFDLDQSRLHPPSRISELYTFDITLFIRAVWQEISAQYVTVTRKGAVKLVIFDIDDTLWRGVVAELDSPDPISLEGWPLGLAEAALYLKQRGIIIAIVSKNDETRVREIWNSMWRGRLLLEDFAAIKINWNNKADNVAQIIKEVNVLPDSVVFIDDNPVERYTVESALPGIRTLGSQLYNVRRTLLWAAEMQPAVITEEGARRNEMIKAQIERDSVRMSVDRETFLASLQIKFDEIVIDNRNHPRFARAFELLNKTNQFNTTGQRWSEEELSTAFEQGLVIYAFEVSDRFTDYGLVGLALVVEDTIEQFVMSCRVIGLDVELQSLFRIKSRHSRLKARYKQTEKNFLCRDLFEMAGFEAVGDDWEWQERDASSAAA